MIIQKIRDRLSGNIIKRHVLIELLVSNGEDETEVQKFIEEMITSGVIIATMGVENKFLCMDEDQDKYKDVIDALSEVSEDSGFFNSLFN